MDATEPDLRPVSSEPTAMNDVEPGDADRLLRIYLQDHFAGSTAGLALVRRCRRANPTLEPLLADLERDIVEDRKSLESIMSRLGVQPSRVKSAFGSVAELVGRLKNNGTVTRYSPSSRVIELEGLAAGVMTKRNLWNALSTIAADRSELDAAELDRLIERSTAQLESIMGAHRPAAAEAFATAQPTAQPRT
jgi:predicted DNA-binding ribbon-helix-helix protein